VGPDTVTCPVAAGVVVDASGRDDRIKGPRSIRAGVSVRLVGGSGRDLIEGGPGDERLEGGNGMDELLGGGGDGDVLLGGDDNDDVFAPAGRVVCGGGGDEVYEAPTSVARRIGPDCESSLLAGSLMIATYAEAQRRRRRVMRIDNIGEGAFRGLLVFKSRSGRIIGRHRVRLTEGGGGYIGVTMAVDLPLDFMMVFDATRPEEAGVRLHSCVSGSRCLR
jgi:hypothetical protein